MDKILIIIKREYLNIVTKKSFLIATFLVPLGFALFIGIEIAALQLVEKEKVTILIPKSQVSIFSGEYSLVSETDLNFKVVDQPEDSLIQQMFRSEETLLVLYLPPQELIASKRSGSAKLIGKTTISEGVKSRVRRKVSEAIESFRIHQAGFTEAQLDQIKYDLDMMTEKRDPRTGEEKRSNTFLAMAVGFGICMIIYMLVAIYGSILMQGVIEEKANRIVEIIISSVKPFELLLGKVIGMASVAITQLLLWGVLVAGIYFLALPFLVSQPMDPNMMAQPGMDSAQVQAQAMEIVEDIQNFDWGVLWFVPFFFLGGFFLYGSLYAAAASAVDDIRDAQQFTFPLTLPLILGMFAVINIIQNPNSAIATVTSYIPFFSPMTVPTRMALVGVSSIPWYEIVLSMVILVLGFLGCVWVASRIYRVGILMYGKKPTIKEMFRWIRA